MTAVEEGREEAPAPHTWRWLASTVELQRAYGREVDTLMERPEELIEYLRWNAYALIKETTEALDCVTWKPWSTAPPEVRDRAQMLDELVDVGHFLANMAAAIGVTDDEWVAAYQAKQQVNRDRQDSGTYDGHTPSTEHVKTLQRCRSIVSFWHADISTAEMVAVSPREPSSYRLHGVWRDGGTVYVDADYTARGSNSAQIRRYAAALAQHCHENVQEHDVTLHKMLETVPVCDVCDRDISTSDCTQAHCNAGDC